jgi:hypothetical protein
MLSTMPEPVQGVWYAVTATFPDEDIKARYIAWITQGHLEEVRRGGAVSARLVAITEPASPLEVHALYEFPSRHALDVYLRDHAPRLRAEGLARFGPGSGVIFRRQVGTILV